MVIVLLGKPEKASTVIHRRLMKSTIQYPIDAIDISVVIISSADTRNVDIAILRDKEDGRKLVERLKS